TVIATELLILVTTQIDLPLLTPQFTEVLAEQAMAVAIVPCIGRAAIDPVALTNYPQAEHMPRAEGEVIPLAEADAPRLAARIGAPILEIIRPVLTAPHLHATAPDPQRLIAEGGAQHVLHTLAVRGKARRTLAVHPVEVIMGARLQQTGGKLQVVIQLHAAAQAAGQVAIAVVVGLITTGARLLGFEAMTGLAARRQTVPGRPRRAAHPATGRARRLAAIAKTEEWP